MTSKHLREVFGFVSSPRVPSLLSLCLHSSTFNLPLFLSFYVPGFLHLCGGEPMFCLMQPVWIFLFFFFTNRAVPPAITTCATDLRATRADRLDSGPAPDSLLLQIPRQGVLAWLYPSEQQPGLSPGHQIGSICVSALVANTNTVHLLILIHPPSIHVSA